MSVNCIGDQVRTGFSQQQNSAIASLQKFKESLQHQIKLIQDSKDDPKTKQEKIKEIQAQIQQIDQEIAQLQAEEKRKQTEQMAAKANSSANNNNENSKSFVLSSQLTDLLSSNGAMSGIKTLANIKKNFENQKNTAATEMKNSVGLTSNTTQINTIVDATGRITGLTADLGRKMGEVTRKINHLDKTTQSPAGRTKLDKQSQNQILSTNPIDESNDKGNETDNSDSVNQSINIVV